MGRRSKRSTTVANEERWKGAVECVHEETGRVIQMVGLDSATGTVFARIPLHNNIEPSPEGNEHVVITLGEMIEIVLSRSDNHSIPAITAQSLCLLGAVWILQRNNEAHPQNPPKWHREFNTEYNLLDDRINFGGATVVTVRIHCRPARFPAFQEIQIATIQKEVGFILVDKPGGCPSHATVDNGVENVLAAISSSATEFSDSGTFILPQRLDIETSGLLLVCTLPKFASYTSKLLEEKTKSWSEHRNSDNTCDIHDNKITKKYRCLVVISEEGKYKELQHLHKSNHVVTHFCDPGSPAPKTFLRTMPLARETQNKWSVCRLRLTNVSKSYPVSSTYTDNAGSSISLATALCYDNSQALDTSLFVELEVELLTGRTHQIRGQLSAIGAPIVGDPLYGGEWKQKHEEVFERFTTNLMALQCCAIEFDMPTETDRYQFQLDSAWWRDYLKMSYTS